MWGCFFFFLKGENGFPFFERPMRMGKKEEKENIPFDTPPQKLQSLMYTLNYAQNARRQALLFCFSEQKI